ncbi:hypothetical protein [Streptomyces sp. NPDC000851]
MRDKRESTHANGSEGARAPVMASQLPKTLGARLRAARMTVGLSQGAVAKTMSDRGFPWRQTTVAKSEGADRPVLFAEVAALAQIYHRPIEYFLHPGTTLDGVLDQAKSELQSIHHALEAAEQQVSALKNDQTLYECTAGLAHSVVRYQNTGDGGLLLADLQYLHQEFGQLVLEIDEVYEALDLDEAKIVALDDAALREVAQAEMEGYRRLSEHDMQYESTELLIGLSEFLEGKEVPDSLLAALRDGTDWPNMMALLLADLLIDAVHRKLSGQ